MRKQTETSAMSSSVKVAAIPPEMVTQFWATIQPFIAKALEHGWQEYSELELCEWAKNGEVLFLVFYNNDRLFGVASLMMITRAKHKECVGMLCGGDEINEWLDIMVESVEKLAKEQGCEVCTIVGRPGWTRMFKKYGYKMQYYTLARNL